MSWSIEEAVSSALLDRIVDEYVRRDKTAQEIADAHGISRQTVLRRLRERGITPRPRGWRPGTTLSEDARRRISEGARAWSKSDEGRKRLTDPAALERLHAGQCRFREEVEQVKTERGLIDEGELLERLRRAGLPRSREAIYGHVRMGLIGPAPGLPFDKPRLYTPASADELIAQLRDYPDGRLRRFAATAFRAAWYRARHPTSPTARGYATRDSARSRAARQLEGEVARLWATDATHDEIAHELGISPRYVRMLAQRLQLPKRRRGRRPRK